jgi:MSHA pilin protein MshC
MKNAGFTIIEIVVVLIVIGIVSGFAVGRAVFTEPDLEVQSEVFKAHLRHAQSWAMSSNQFWGIQTDAAGSTYSLFKYDPTSGVTLMKLPGQSSTTIDLGAMGLSIAGGDTGKFSFDSRGIPYYADVASSPPGAPQTASDISITLNGGSGSATITITKNTGFIP